MSAFTLSAARQTLRIAPSSARRASATRRSTTVRAMAKQIISTDKAPSALGPYNQAVKVGNTVYVSGQIGLTTEMKMVGETIEEQTTQVLKNMGAILEAAGASFDDVVRCTIFLANMDDFKAVNGIYGEKFGDNAPTRATVAVSTLPLNALVEIDCIAVIE